MLRTPGPRRVATTGSPLSPASMRTRACPRRWEGLGNTKTSAPRRITATSERDPRSATPATRAESAGWERGARRHTPRRAPRYHGAVVRHELDEPFGGRLPRRRGSAAPRRQHGHVSIDRGARRVELPRVAPLGASSDRPRPRAGGRDTAPAPRHLRPHHIGCRPTRIRHSATRAGRRGVFERAGGVVGQRHAASDHGGKRGLERITSVGPPPRDGLVTFQQGPGRMTRSGVNPTAAVSAAGDDRALRSTPSWSVTGDET